MGIVNGVGCDGVAADGTKRRDGNESIRTRNTDNAESPTWSSCKGADGIVTHFFLVQMLAKMTPTMVMAMKMAAAVN